MYTYRFTSFTSFNDSVPAYPSVAGICHFYYQYVNSDGVSTVNCTQRYSRNSGSYSLTVGRYVTVLPNYPSTWYSVLTVCEVQVIGVRQDISADGNYYMSHCYTIAWDRLSNQFFCLCMYVCVCLWARLRSHFSTDLHEIW